MTIILRSTFSAYKTLELNPPLTGHVVNIQLLATLPCPFYFQSTFFDHRIIEEVDEIEVDEVPVDQIEVDESSAKHFVRKVWNDSTGGLDMAGRDQLIEICKLIQPNINSEEV